MITPGTISNGFTESDDLEEKRSRSSVVKIVSILTALAITAGLLIGFLVWRKLHEERVGIEREQPNAVGAVRPVLPAKVQIYMDEPVRKGPQALIGGTVHNISGESLANVAIEIELTRRKDATTEVRSLALDPTELAPDQKGRYSLTLTGDYRSIKLLKITSGSDSAEIGYKAAPGAARPVEHPPDTKTIIVGRPSAPGKGEEFINTPDNPAKIP